VLMSVVGWTELILGDDKAVAEDGAPASSLSCQRDAGRDLRWSAARMAERAARAAWAWMMRSRRVRGGCEAAAMRVEAAWRVGGGAAAVRVRVWGVERSAGRVSRRPGLVSVRASACSRVERRLRGAAFQRPVRGMVRVGFASREVVQNSRQASELRAAVAMFRRMSIFGGAEAPEQLLDYLERRQAVSVQAGSVYRSVNVAAAV
jgi:hypothetical protein